MSVSAASFPFAPARAWPQKSHGIPTRDPADSALRWRGAGAIAFVGAWDPDAGPLAVPSDGALLEIGTGEALPSGGDPTRAAGSSSSLYRAVAAYHRPPGGAGGARACLVLGDSRCAHEAGWIGEDGGPGRSTGVYSLAWVEEVGTICVPGALPPVALRRITELACRRPDLGFLVCGEASGPAPDALRHPDTPGLRFPCPNVAVLVAGSGGKLDGPAALGHLAAYVESRDFCLEPPFRFDALGAPPWLGERESRWLQAWRRHQGLWRSLDIGTRWVLLERDHPTLWGRVERDVRGFLRDLQGRGLLASEAEGGEPWVACRRGAAEPRAAQPRVAERTTERATERATEEAASLVIRVGARLRAPYAADLAALMEAALMEAASATGEGDDPSVESEREPENQPENEPERDPEHGLAPGPGKGEDVDDP